MEATLNKIRPIVPPKPKKNFHDVLPPPPEFSSTRKFDHNDDIPNENFPPPPPPITDDSFDHVYDARAALSQQRLSATGSPTSSSYSELKRTNYSACGPKPYSSSFLSPAPFSNGKLNKADSKLSFPLETTNNVMSPHTHDTTPVGSDRNLSAVRSTDDSASVLDSLTSLLIQEMNNDTSSSEQTNSHGICHECGQNINVDERACMTMERTYHMDCFKCSQCQFLLGTHQYYIVDNKQHCYDCYKSRLDKCCICNEPIFDRILRATGKFYHPNCFKCVVCGQCLEGISFTVDSANQIYCLDDFHNKFAAKCSVCNEPIKPLPGKSEAVRIVALDRDFHVECYKCEDCGLVLRKEEEDRKCYPLDGHVLCQPCNTQRLKQLQF